MKALFIRTVIGTLLFIGFASAIWFSQGQFSIIFPLICSCIVALALSELYTLSEAKGYPSLKYLGIASTVLYIMAIWLDVSYPLSEMVLFWTLFLGFCYYFFNGDKPLLSLAMTLFGIGYLTLPLSALVRIIYENNGREWLIYLLIIKAATDGGGYFLGSLYGKRPLAPAISPHKTWEGALSGIVLSMVVTLILYFSLPNPLTLSAMMLLVISLSILIIIGDLAESLIKRDIGVKDSAHIPGVGGVLDTIDSLVFAAPFLYLFLKTTGV